MNKEDLKVKDYRLQFADDRFYSFPCVNDLQAKQYARHLISRFVSGDSSKYRLIKGTFANLFVSLDDEQRFLSKVYPLKTKFFKAVNLWSGKRTFVPVDSRHVVHCAKCRYLVEDYPGVCNRCQGCLDCRGNYYRPVTESVSFVELLDRFDKYYDLPF